MKMAGSGVEGAGFWLPSDFLSDDDFLTEKESFRKSGRAESDTEFCFPTEFPYDSEAETDQLLEKVWMMSTSPRSTLARHLRSDGRSSNGSPSAVPSPPTTPLGAKYDAVGDLIHLAAGQVEKLRLNHSQADSVLPVPPGRHPQFYPGAKTATSPVYRNAHSQNRGGRVVEGMGHTAWTLPQNPTRGRAIPFGGSGSGGGVGGAAAAAKRTCAGTGVFLPRRYENFSNSNAHSSGLQGKTGRTPIHVHTKSLYDANQFVQSQPQPLPGVSPSFILECDLLLAKRHVLLLQRRRDFLASLAEGSAAMMGSDQYLLPREWTY